jgi:uncharacterized membrane-anchored protein
MKTWNLFAVIWAVVLLGAWLIREDYRAKQGEVVEIAITGYDPRDLLAGHYVTYRLDLGEAASCTSRNVTQGAYCLCLKISGEGSAKADYGAPCRSAKMEGCNIKLKGRCLYGFPFESGIERYYIPEEYAPFLTTIPADSRVLARIDSNGRASLQKLKVGGKDLTEYVAEQKAAMHSPNQ